MDTRQKVFMMEMQGGAAVFTVSGTVYDSDGVTAVASATVALGSASATSAADGTYTLTVAAGASGSLTCAKTGYSWAAITVAAISGDLASQDFLNKWWAAGESGASCVAAYAAVGAASYAASKVNLANPGTNNITDGANKPTWAADSGWTFAGTESAFSTGIIPADTQGRTAVVSYTETNFGAYRVIFGAYSNPNAYLLRYENPDDKTHFFNGSGSAGVSNRITSGVVAMAGNKGYLNGADLGFTIGAGNYAMSHAIYIGMLNNGGGAAQDFIGSVRAFAYYSAALTPTQVAAVSAAFP